MVPYVYNEGTNSRPSYHTKEHFSVRMQVLPIIHLNQRPNATDKGNFFFFF